MRLRITFSKSGALIYTSHLDLMRIWERCLRRAGVPLVYSQGFNPRPKLQLAGALPLGYAAQHELLDIWLEEPMAPAAVTKALTPVLVEGMTVSDVQAVEPGGPSLPSQVVSSVYRATVEASLPADEVQSRIERVLAADELMQERRGKMVDLRPLIERLDLLSADGRVVELDMQLASRPGATGRPAMVVKALGLADAYARFCRQRLLLKSAGRGRDG